MKTRLLCLALFAASLMPAQTATYLAPQGAWPICQTGIQFPGCIPGSPKLYMLITDSALPWTITAIMQSGDTVILQGTGQTFSLNFGGVVASWTIVFQRRRE